MSDMHAYYLADPILIMYREYMLVVSGVEVQTWNVLSATIVCIEGRLKSNQSACCDLLHPLDLSWCPYSASSTVYTVFSFPGLKLGTYCCMLHLFLLLIATHSLNSLCTQNDGHTYGGAN